MKPTRGNAMKGKRRRRKSEDVETHLDVMIKNTKDESLEERYLKAKKTFLTGKLAHIQEEIDSKNISQDIGFLIMILYIFEFIEKEVGKIYAEHMLDFLSFTGWPLELFKPILDQGSFEEKVDLAVKTNYRNLDASTHTRTVELVLKVWKGLRLDREFEKEIEKVVEGKKALYSLIGSKPDLERRSLVKRLAAKGEKRIKLKLLNVGIVPTERCPNSCRFCLAPWKASVEERRGKALSEEEFKKIADQVIELADEKNLILTITGGEPFLELERVLYILRNAKTRVDVSTSGFWAGDLEGAEGILSKLSQAIKENKNPKFSFSLQVSLDSFHQEIRLENGSLRENVPLSNIANIIELTQTKFSDIEVCPLTKYTLYEDPLVRLLIELKKRGLKAKLVNKYSDPRMKVSVVDREGKLVAKPALLKAYLGFDKGTPILISYSVVENIGRASILEPFEFPAFRQQTEDFISSKDAMETLPLIGLEVSDDGNVYPGAHSLYSWSIGNVLETDLREIYNIAEYDPLFIALAENPVRIKNMALELEPKGEEELRQASSPLVAIFKILENQWIRLYITKRLIMEDPAYSSELKEELGLDISPEELKEEYHLKSQSF
jgi:organic radical activating enzyme